MFVNLGSEGTLRVLAWKIGKISFGLSKLFLINFLVTHLDEINMSLLTQLKANSSFVASADDKRMDLFSCFLY